VNFLGEYKQPSDTTFIKYSHVRPKTQRWKRSSRVSRPCEGYDMLAVSFWWVGYASHPFRGMGPRWNLAGPRATPQSVDQGSKLPKNCEPESSYAEHLRRYIIACFNYNRINDNILRSLWGSGRARVRSIGLLRKSSQGSPLNDFF